MIDLSGLPDLECASELQEVRLVGGFLDGETLEIHPSTIQFVARNLRGRVSIYRNRGNGTFRAITP